MIKLTFEHNEIFEINGSSKVPFNGSFSPQELAEELVKRWIPYYECHKCGKGDYCKYAIPEKGNTFRRVDIKCGVATNALMNFILRTAQVVNLDDRQKHQEYIDCAYYFYKYIYRSEQMNGLFIDDIKLDCWGDRFTYFFDEILSIRDVLNEFGRRLKDFPSLFKRQSILLVEGESEKTFIMYLKGDECFSKTFCFVVESYKGKSNKHPKRIQMLLEDYLSKGYSIYIQGDEDGNSDGSGYDKFKHYIDKKIVTQEQIFQFKYDLESSIPRSILLDVLNEFGELIDVTLDEFDQLPMNISINKSLKEVYNIDTERNNLKIKIAKKVGHMFFNYGNDDLVQFENYEITKFVRFLESIE